MLKTGLFGGGTHTESAGTVITETIVPRYGSMPRCRHYVYTPGATTHTLSAMKGWSYTTLSAAAAAAQAVIALTADPGTGTTPGAIAANDFVLVEMPTGAWHLGKVSSVATLNVTLTANVPTGGFNKGAKVWFLGAPADNEQFTLTTGAQRTLGSDTDDIGFVGGDIDGSPLVLHVDNATNAGTLDRFSGFYFSPAA